MNADALTGLKRIERSDRLNGSHCDTSSVSLWLELRMI
jgi:hypothetical protein